ncbi:MAG: hypothetical protein GC180_05505 [Bacteroidetes bacterium]|nr:hypothetical protein [Bacteroidota bacterium]
MNFKLTFTLLILYCIAPSCQFKEETLYSSVPALQLPLIDSVRDAHMEFDVKDYNSGLTVGKEIWEYKDGYQINNYHYYTYSVNRGFPYDSSGGTITIANHNELYYLVVFDSTLNKYLYPEFMDARNDHYYPEDPISNACFADSSHGLNKYICTRTYRGLVQVLLNGKGILTHHAARDSSAIPGTSAPYEYITEDYFYERGFGLAVMKEARYQHTDSGDFILHSVIKTRR